MKISDRITGTIENWRVRWGEVLKGWLVSFLSIGLDAFFRILGKSFSPLLTPMIERMEQSEQIPPELQKLFDEIKNPTGEVGAILAQSAGGAIVGGAIGKVVDAYFLRFGYQEMSRMHPVILNPEQLTSLWQRGEIKADELKPFLRKHGFDDDAILGMQQLAKIRLDPMSVITAWRRDPEKYNVIFKELYDQGWTPERVDILKFVTQFYPSPQDLVNWQAKEVFEPDMIRKYQLDEEFTPLMVENMRKAGISSEQALNFWRAHWVHPEFGTIVQMLRRTDFTEADMAEWFRLVEIPTFWRQKLIDISYAIPTRVDIRRFYDMRTIDESRLRELYINLGYHGKDLDDYIQWTKIYTDFPMMMTRFKNGWISENEVYDWLIVQGIPEERARHFIEEKVKPLKPERVTKERDLTKAEIVKGVKKEVITVSQGIELLQDMGYSLDEAKYIIEINVAALEGSPDTFTEFKKITQLYRVSQGLKAAIPPPELLEAEKALNEAKAQLAEAEAKKLKDAKIAPFLKTISDAQYRYRQFLVKWEETKK